jgi:hypothetical protein
VASRRSIPCVLSTLALLSLAAPAVADDAATRNPGGTPGEGQATQPSAAGSDAPPAAPATEASVSEDQGPPTEAGMTIWVFEDGEVKRTREEVGIALRDLGYHKRKTANGRDVYANEDPWKPWVYVDDDGWMMMRRAPVTVSKPPLPGIWAGPLGWLVCVPFPTACVHVGGQVVSRAKLHPQKVEVIETIGPAMDHYQSAIVERAMKARVDVTVPQALDALWTDGVPFSGEGRLESWAERRAAIVDFWLGRADDGYGDRVREVVELWSRNTIQAGDEPFTTQEIADAAARRTCTRPIEGLFYVVQPALGAEK